MPSLEQNKVAMQNLIAKANAKTGNTAADLTSAVDELITGYGQGGSGECTLPHIIEVDELPTDNIDDNAIYKVKDWKLSDIYVVNSKGKYQSLYTMLILVSAFAESPRMPNIYNVKTFAEIESIVTDEYKQLDLYYVQDENMVYGYTETDTTFTDSLTPMPNGTEINDGVVKYSILKEYAYYKHAVGRFDDIIFLENGTVVSIKEQNLAPFADMNYVDVTFTAIDSPAEEFLLNQATSNFGQGYINIYYFPNEGIIVNYDYANSIWNIAEVTLTFITDKSQATEEGVFYGLREAPLWDKYEMPRGILSSSKVGEYLNVKNYKGAILSVPEYDGGVVYG